MKKILLFSMAIGLTICMNAQSIMPIATLPNSPKDNAVALMPKNMPALMKSYQNVGWVSSEAYMKYLVPSSYNISSKRTSFDIFPDSSLFNVFDQGDTVKKYSTYMHAIGNSFDPYSESYDKMCMSGLFPTPTWPAIQTFGYNIDTISVYGVYYWGDLDHYNPNSPDTLRVFLAYHKVYEQIGNKTEWTNLHWVSDKANDTDLFAPMIRVDTIKVKQQCGSAITPAAENYITIDYLLTANDTTLFWDSVNASGDTVRYYRAKNFIIPTTLNGVTEEGFIVPAGAVTSCIVKYIPGYAYKPGDSLEYGKITPDNKYLPTYPRHRHNCFAVMAYNESNSKAYCDPYGFNFNFYEHTNTRYQTWMTNDTTPNTLYNSMYYPNAHILPLFAYHMSVDSSNMVEVCDSLLYKKEHKTDSTSIREAEILIKSVYPNPAKDYVVVSLKNNDPATIRIINVMGQVMRTVNTNEERNRISTKDLSAGIYFLSVEQNGRRFTTKFSKQ